MDSAGLHFELLRNLHSGVVVHAPDSSIVFSNLRATALLGLSEDQMLGKTVMDAAWKFVDEASNTLAPEQYPVSRVLASHQAVEDVVLGVHSPLQKEVTWLSVSVFPDFYPDGMLKQVVANFYSITKRKRLERQLQETAWEIHDLYDNAPCGYFSLDTYGRFMRVNATLLQWLGYGTTDLVGQMGMRDIFPEEERAAFTERFQLFKCNGRLVNFEVNLLCADGSLRHVSISASAVRDENGNFSHSRAVAFDLTALQAAKNELTVLHREQDAMLDNDMIGIVQLTDRRQTWTNKAMTRIFGYAARDMLGHTTELFYPDEASYLATGKEIYPILQSGGHFRKQVEMRHQNGSSIWVEVHGVALSAHKEQSIWLLVDVTEQKRYQLAVEHIAFHDNMTGLPNRLLLEDRMAQSLATTARTKQFLSVCFIDLDGFKAINDKYGHAAGDAVLKQVAERLQSCVRPSDTVARLGGDEFVILFTQLDATNDFGPSLKRIFEEFSRPFKVWDALEVTMSASMGVALYPGDGETVDILIRNADRAMYQSKLLGKNRVSHYEPKSFVLA